MLVWELNIICFWVAVFWITWSWLGRTTEDATSHPQWDLQGQCVSESQAIVPDPMPNGNFRVFFSLWFYTFCSSPKVSCHIGLQVLCQVKDNFVFWFQRSWQISEEWHNAIGYIHPIASLKGLGLYHTLWHRNDEWDITSCTVGNERQKISFLKVDLLLIKPNV